MEISQSWLNRQQKAEEGLANRIGQYVRASGHHANRRDSSILRESREIYGQNECSNGEPEKKYSTNGGVQTCPTSKMSGNEDCNKNKYVSTVKDHASLPLIIPEITQKEETPSPQMNQIPDMSKKATATLDDVSTMTAFYSSEQKINQNLDQQFKKAVTEEPHIPLDQNSIAELPLALETSVEKNDDMGATSELDECAQNRQIRSTHETESIISLEIDNGQRGITENSLISIQDIANKQHIDCVDKSSTSSDPRERQQQIWDQNEYQLQDISKLKQKESLSNSQGQSVQDSAFEARMINFQNLKNEKEELLKENNSIKAQNTLLKEDNEKLQERVSLLAHKNSQFKILRMTDQEKRQELLEENQELNDLVLHYKRTQYENQILLKEQKDKLIHLEEEMTLLQSKIQKKDDYINSLMNHIEQKTHQCEQAETLAKEIEEVMNKKMAVYEEKIVELQNEINQLRETVEFYKGRMQEEGLTLNIEQIKRIKEEFQKQAEHQEKVIKNISKEYQQSIVNLQHKNKTYASELSQLKSKIQQTTKDDLKNQLIEHKKQTQKIINHYDSQLELRDNQIISLRKDLQSQNQLMIQVNLNNCKRYFQHVDKLRTLLLDQSIERYSEPQLVMEFQYIVNKLTKMLAVAQKKLGYMGQEKENLYKFINQKELLFKEDNQRYTAKITQIEAEIKLLRVTNEELNKKLEQFREEKINGSIVLESERSSLCSSIMSIPNKQDSLILGQQSRILNQTCILDNSFLEAGPEAVPQYTLHELLKKCSLSMEDKRQLSLALILFAQRMLKENKRKISLKPSHILVTPINGAFEIALTKTVSKLKDQSQKSLIFSSPEVLLGFSQSEQTYVWTIGMMIDCIFHGTLFFKRISQVTSRSENYYVRDPSLPVKIVLETMMKKKQKERCLLETAKTLLMDIRI